ncbi:hypothetical protein AYK25_04995 [Thermoplasmatales archaeon SM1-50]|nr:MAG: hypothetical protein AYK25_04995 [Thermoplasmatales archaeon SM1-50]
MRKKTMRKLIILFVGLFVITTSVLPSIGSTSSQTNDAKSITKTTDGVSITVHSMEETITIDYALETFAMKPVVINDIEYTHITLGNEANSLVAGAPDLPYIARSIIIPDTGTMDIQVIATEYTDYENIRVAPSKGNLPRTVNPDDVPYTFGTIYSQNFWYPTEIAQLQEPYILRDFRGQVITIYPFQYNPVEATLRFYTDITVQVSLIQNDLATSLVAIKQLDCVDSEFSSIYERHFINYDMSRYTPVSEQGNMLVITYDAFYNDMLPFVEWKNFKGIPTEMVNVSTIGNNANAIKTYITNYYNTNGLTFVLLVGDAAQIVPGTSGSIASDPWYSFINGSDYYSELFIGRFSAENTQHVITQVNRTIMYERYPMVDGEWYHKGVGVASNQGAGIGDNGEADNEHMDVIRGKLLNYTYTYVDRIYDPTGTAAQVSSALNDGRSIVNYCGHGSTTSWGTTGFSNTHINALTNYYMLPFICSVACVNGAFVSTTCFAEAWLRATQDGQPTGAIGAFMSTISQSWAPPMKAQDEYIDILVENYADNKKTTYGALMFHGCMAMNDKYGSSGYTETAAWTVFGDPSVQVRTNTPVAMTVLHDDFIINGVTSFELDIPDFPGALCAVSKNSVLLGNGYADASGHAVIEFFEPLAEEDYVDLVVTGYNALPYITTLSIGEPNIPPLIPQKPEGPASGKPGVSYLYRTSTTDADGDAVYYLWDWGDSTFSEWIGPFNSGETATLLHSWPEEGTYAVRVKAKDTYGAETDWSEPLDITLPTSSHLFVFLQHHFPYLTRILEIIRQMII